MYIISDRGEFLPAGIRKCENKYSLDFSLRRRVFMLTSSIIIKISGKNL